MSSLIPQLAGSPWGEKLAECPQLPWDSKACVGTCSLDPESLKKIQLDI